MGLKNTIANASKKAINSMGDLLTPFTLISKGEGTLNFSSGTISYPSDTRKSFEGLISKFSSKEINTSGGLIQYDDKKVVFINDSEIEIGFKDIILIDSENFKIIEPIQKDITGTITTLQIRK
jgi:hypothetical protein